MRIAVCDDDQNFCKEMLKYLQDYFKEKKLKQPEYVCFSNGEAMMKAGGVVDMAFLDVEMNDMASSRYSGKEVTIKMRILSFFFFRYSPA